MLKVNLGCSDDIEPGWLNVDSGPDPRTPQEIEDSRADYLRADLNQPWPWPDNSVDVIYAHDVFEHLGNIHWGAVRPDEHPGYPRRREDAQPGDVYGAFDVPGKIWAFNEAWRVLRPGGMLDMTVPCAYFEHKGQRFLNPGAFADPTHRTFWTWDDQFYFSRQMRDWRTPYGKPAGERGRLGQAYGIQAVFDFPDIAEGVDGRWENVSHPSCDLVWTVVPTGPERAKIVGILRAVK
jgi:predicted SAM-dependent methyltransferase